MKKVLMIFTIIMITLFFINTKVSAINEDLSIYEEHFHSIKFKNLNSKDLNILFKGISGTVIEIEVETKVFTKSYRFNTNMINNIEKSLIEKVSKDLEELGERELKTLYKTGGVKIIRIDIRCTNEALEIIKSRTETE